MNKKKVFRLLSGILSAAILCVTFCSCSLIQNIAGSAFETKMDLLPYSELKDVESVRYMGETGYEYHRSFYFYYNDTGSISYSTDQYPDTNHISIKHPMIYISSGDLITIFYPVLVSNSEMYADHLVTYHAVSVPYSHIIEIHHIDDESFPK